MTPDKQMIERVARASRANVRSVLAALARTHCVGTQAGGGRVTHKAILTNAFSRERFKRIVDKAPAGFVAEVREPRRTMDQNDKMWAMLTDISVSMPMGRRHTPDDWKALAMNACGWECQFLEGLDGRPFPIGFKSSRLTKSQMSTLIDWLQAFGDEHGVKWSDQPTSEAA